MERQVLRGFLANIEVFPPLILTFQFNPESVSDTKATQYGDRDAELCGNAPGKVYTGGGHRTISFDLKLHGLEKGTNALNPTGLDNGIATELAKLRSFVYPKEDAWAAFGSSVGGRRLQAPPVCTFGFGAKILDCVVTELTISETQFNSFLAPVRADVRVTLVVVEDSGNALYELDKHRRNAQAALGLQNVSIY
ncbi:MAG: hypothetical protein EA350_03790 [Gemmatimonadales bacterium]|nr:MAG: hypothetical protein EA350_03790 [Gemmatimonadales bacterium]